MSKQPESSSSPSGANTVTAGELAEKGKKIFIDIASVCHGEQGEGIAAPAVMGKEANLSKYKTAKGLFDFISEAMPFDNPRSLSQSQYLEVMFYLLTQNNLVDSKTPVSFDKLGNITLKK